MEVKDNDFFNAIIGIGVIGTIIFYLASIFVLIEKYEGVSKILLTLLLFVELVVFAMILDIFSKLENKYFSKKQTSTYIIILLLGVILMLIYLVGGLF